MRLVGLGHQDIQTELTSFVEHHLVHCEGRQKFLSYCLVQGSQKVTNIRNGSSQDGVFAYEAMRKYHVSSKGLADCKRGQVLQLPNPTRDLHFQ